MAKRRLNKRFVGVLVGSLVGLCAIGAGIYFVKGRLFKEKPEKYIALGRAYLEQKNYAAARDNLGRAAALSRPDPNLNVMLGDALNGLSAEDRDNVTAARAQWERALGIDPACIPAAEKLIRFWRDDLDLLVRPSSRAQAAAQLRKTAETLLGVDKGNRLGRSADAEAIIEEMIDGVPPDDAVVKAAQDKLVELEAEDPSDADVPYFLARSFICQGQEAARGNNPKPPDQFYVNAEQTMLAAGKVQPQNAYLHYRTGQILLLLASGRRPAQTADDRVKGLITQAVQEIDRASQLARPDEAHYVDISLYDAGLVLDRPSYASDSDADAATPTPAISSGIPANASVVPPALLAGSPAEPQVRAGRAARAEAIYREVLKNRPKEPASRLALADLLGMWPGRREEAIALLSQPFAEGEATPGIKGTLQPVYQAEANIKLLGLKLDGAEAARDKPRQDAILAECDTLCDRVYGNSPNAPQVLALKGRLELLHHRIVEATQTLRNALALMNPQDTVSQQDRYELMYALARAYAAGQQTGEAKKLCTDIISVYGHFIPARVMLARLLISEHSLDEARPQVDYLESVLPANPQLLSEVIRMRIATLDKAKEPEKIKAYYDRAPDSSLEQRLEKASIARMAGYDDEAIRLYLLVHTESPGDAEAATNLANLYLARNLKDKALTVLGESIAVNHSDPSMLAMQMQIEGKTPAEIQASQAQSQVPGSAAAQLAAVSQELSDAEAARSIGDTIGREKHLVAAEKLKPEDARVWDARFTFALDQRNWDQASTYLEKLAANSVDHAGGMLYRVRLAIARSDLQKASELAVQLTRDKPEFSQSWCVLGEVQRASGKYDDAIVNFQLALDRQTQNLDALRGLVECSYAQGKNDEAKRYIDIARRIAPSSEVFKEIELNHELNFGDPQKVIIPRMEAVKTAPENERNWISLASTYVAAAKARAAANDSAASLDYYTQAKATLQEAIAKFPDQNEFTTFFAKTALATNDYDAAQKAMLALCNRDSHKGLARTALMLADFYEAAAKPDASVTVLGDYLAHPASPPDHAGEVAVEIHLATLLQLQHRLNDALAAVAANAQDPQIVRQKVVLLLSDGRYDDADKIFDGLAAAAPLSSDLLSLKGEGALNSGRLSVARQCFDQVLAADPDNVSALTQRAETILREPVPNYNAAITDLSRARDLNPADVNIRLLIADADRRRDQPEEAVKELESAVRIAPANKRVRLSLLDLYANLNPPRWSDAERVMREVKELPQFADDTDLLHAEAIIALGREQLPRAQELIRAALSRSPGNPGIVRTYYDILVKSKAFSELLSHSDQFLAAAKDAPKLWWMYPYRAKARIRGMGDKAGAAQEYQHALTLAAALHDENASGEIMHSLLTELGPDTALGIASARAQGDSHWRIIAAKICQQKGDANAALGWLDKALSSAEFDKLSPTDQDVALRLAATEYQAKLPPDTVNAVQIYRRLIERFPEDVSSLNNLACLLVETSPAYDPVAALSYSERAYNQMMSSGLDEPLIKDTYGWALILNGRIDEGMTLIQDALTKKDFPEAHYHLAEGFLKRQPPSPTEATSEFTKAMRIIDQAERDGTAVDETLKSRVQNEMKKTSADIPG